MRAEQLLTSVSVAFVVRPEAPRDELVTQGMFPDRKNKVKTCLHYMLLLVYLLWRWTTGALPPPWKGHAIEDSLVEEQPQN